MHPETVDNFLVPESGLPLHILIFAAVTPLLGSSEPPHRDSATLYPRFSPPGPADEKPGISVVRNAGYPAWARR